MKMEKKDFIVMILQRELCNGISATQQVAAILSKNITPLHWTIILFSKIMKFVFGLL